MSEQALEAEARVDLAAALRWASRLGYGEGICNHFSVELPDGSGRFLLNPRLREAVRLMRALWAGERVTFDGDYYRTVDPAKAGWNS